MIKFRLICFYYLCLYYFLSSQGEFLLLCGPISPDIYDIACEELKASPRFSAMVNTRGDIEGYKAPLLVDRLGE